MNAWLEKYPKVKAFLNAVVDAGHYTVTGGWIVDLVRWLVETGGNIAESAFVLATVYVTVNVVAHLLVTWVLPAATITMLNQLSVIAFSVLPELIVVSALVVCFDHWRLAFQARRPDAWAWAIAYSLPTAVFLGMTIYTITSFVTFEVSHTGASFIATGPMLVTRCLAGWSYGTVQMLFARLGKPGYTSWLDSLQSELAAVGIKLQERDTTVAGLQSELAALALQMEGQEHELAAARVQVAAAKVSRDPLGDMAIIEKATHGKVTPLRSDDGDSSKRAKLKRHMRGVILAGKKLNYKEIARDTRISYTTVRTHASAIIQEIAAERVVGSERVTDAMQVVVEA